MKNYSIELSLISLLLFVPMLVFWLYGDKLLIRRPQPAPISAINLILGASSASNPRPTKVPTQTPMPTRGVVVAARIIRPTQTPIPKPTDVPTEVPTDIPVVAAPPTNTPTFGQMLHDHIVFYLIQPEPGHDDACGNVQLVPIISRRMRTGDKYYDVQVALEMLFNLKRKIYIKWYNALWDTDLSIDKTQTISSKSQITINFTGYLPTNQLSSCDSHGIREQILATVSHYGVQAKSFTANGASFP